jgi:hypothetical protein
VPWDPERGARPRRHPITGAPPPVPASVPPLLPMLHVAALLGVVGWAVFLAATTTPWVAMGSVTLTCALAYKLVATVQAYRAAERAERAQAVAFDVAALADCAEWDPLGPLDELDEL